MFRRKIGAQILKFPCTFGLCYLLLTLSERVKKDLKILNMSKSCCCVKGCTNNINKNPEYSYYAIPSSGNRRKLWLAAIGRAVVDNSGIVCKNRLLLPKSVHRYVCSKRFISG